MRGESGRAERCGRSGGFHPGGRRHAAVTGLFNRHTRSRIVPAVRRSVVLPESGQDEPGTERRREAPDQNVLTDSEEYHVNTCSRDPIWHLRRCSTTAGRSCPDTLLAVFTLLYQSATRGRLMSLGDCADSNNNKLFLNKIKTFRIFCAQLCALWPLCA